MKKLIQLVFVFGFLFLITSGQTKDDFILAKKYFNELDSLCNLDNGKLWGIKLNAPVMFVFPSGRNIIANTQDRFNNLVKRDGVYFGRLSDDLNIANTIVDWGGVKWVMVIWDPYLKNNSIERNSLLIHESWHRIQDQIKIPSAVTENAHLDELYGTIFIKLEIRALRRALSVGTETDRKNALTDAVIIRNYRQSLFPKNNENLFERFEGIAEYTGLKLCGMEQSLMPVLTAKQLGLADNKDGFANSFAYITGPAYCFLFDILFPDWRKEVIAGKNLFDIAKRISTNEFPVESEKIKEQFTSVANKYNYEGLVKIETAKFAEQQKLTDLYKEIFLKNPVLVIPNRNIKFSFNPQEKLIPVEDKGVVYKTMNLIAEWGILDVKNGILRSNDWGSFTIKAPSSKESLVIEEDGYRLTLKPGWKLKQIENGNFEIIKE